MHIVSKLLVNFLGFLLMWHVLLHWLQLHSKRNSSSLFLALLLLFRSFCLWSYSLKKNRLFFCSVKHEATEATLQQGDTYTDMKKISKGLGTCLFVTEIHKSFIINFKRSGFRNECFQKPLCKT